MLLHWAFIVCFLLGSNALPTPYSSYYPPSSNDHLTHYSPTNVSPSVSVVSQTEQPHLSSEAAQTVFTSSVSHTHDSAPLSEDIPVAELTTNQFSNEVEKNSYTFVAPDMPAGPPVVIQGGKGKIRKRYNVIFIKTPSMPAPEIIVPQILGGIQEKNLIYVLQETPRQPIVPTLQQLTHTASLEPDVFVVKYDGAQAGSQHLAEQSPVSLHRTEPKVTAQNNLSQSISEGNSTPTYPIQGGYSSGSLTQHSTIASHSGLHSEVSKTSSVTSEQTLQPAHELVLNSDSHNSTTLTQGEHSTVSEHTYESPQVVESSEGSDRHTVY